MSGPTMLYNDPHPVHERMAEEVGAAMVRAEPGPPWKRVAAAATSRYYGMVILEGGMPLIQGASIKALGRADTVVMLAGDETLLNQAARLPYYSPLETAAHSVSLRMIDGVVSISDEMARIAREEFGLPAVVSRPFVLDGLGTLLDGNEPDLDGERILCVAENRPAFDQEALLEAAGDREVVLVGKGTKALGGRGFVPIDELARLYRSSDLFVLPAVASGFGIAPIESMTAGVPAIVSSNSGAAEVVGDIDDGLVSGVSAESMRRAIDWYFEEADRRELSRLSREAASGFTEGEGAAGFARQLDALEAML